MIRQTVSIENLFSVHACPCFQLKIKISSLMNYKKVNALDSSLHQMCISVLAALTTHNT